jgi:hypothetical protein
MGDKFLELCLLTRKNTRAAQQNPNFSSKCKTCWWWCDEGDLILRIISLLGRWFPVIATSSDDCGCVAEAYSIFLFSPDLFWFRGGQFVRLLCLGNSFGLPDLSVRLLFSPDLFFH